MTHIHPITTIDTALKWARGVLSGNPDAVKEARILLSEVLEASPEYLIRYPERVLTVAQADEFNKLIGQRSQGRPIAYLLGRRGFYDIEVEVNPDVLIPRPETEHLVEKAIEWAAGKGHLFVVDVGTGSGAIALTLAKHLPDAHVSAIDLSEAALKVAQRNADKLDLSKRVHWLQGDLLQPLVKAGEQAHLMVANLPYITTSVLMQLEVARHEPLLALDGGRDGLEVFRRLLEQAPQVLHPEGIMFLEIGADQGEALPDLIQNKYPALAVVAVEQDLAGLDRIVTVQPAN